MRAASKLAAGALCVALSACVTSAYSPSGTPATAPPDSGVEPMPRPPTHTPPAGPPAPTPTPFDPVRIAAGATAPYTDPAGHVWAADVDFTGGVTSVSANPVAIAGTDAAPLYNAERYGDAGSGFRYAIPVPNGDYVVRLGFAETFLQAAGQRLFDVSINGSKVLTAFDIFTAAGGMNRAVVESFPTTVSTGQLELSFAAGAIQNPKIDAIEIVAADATDGGVGP